ncbi:MAG: C25 family cysteine peptidase [candidate division KSB1 bacterium]|nr:C25 family cysteine peptidase [candidate division KSB1 bacterium]MDZ7384669.1 C25 family cysteine peptidase [candidate division KSB1 bacterium]
MRRRLLVVATLCVVAGAVYPEEFPWVVRFSLADMHLEPAVGFTRVTMDGCELTEVVGEPQVPVRIVRLALPPGARVTGIETDGSAAHPIAFGVKVIPAQPPEPYSLSRTVGFVPPKAEVYEREEPYPRAVVELLGQGQCAGLTIAELAVYPIAFAPARGEVLLREEVLLRVRYDRAFSRGSVDAGLLSMVEALVENKSELRLFAAEGLNKGGSAPAECHEYVIITPAAFKEAFQPLAEWKRQKGLGAVIVTTEEIYRTYPAKDNAVRVREFLKAARQAWNLRWVLLGGDVDAVPYRTAYAMDCLQGEKANAIPCDLYFSDLDRTWDENGSRIYGEVADSVDLYPDVFVGRAPVNNVAQVETFVRKVLTYEQAPPRDYLTRALFAADVLWENPYTDSGLGKDLIDELYVPARFSITKLYRSRGNESVQSVVAALNQGMNLVNHDGHAFTTVMGVGNGYLQLADMDRLANGPRYSVLYSIGCYPANFEEDCIAEHFVRNPRGGGVVFIGNSRYGWGSPGNPKYGYSDRFDQQFYRFLMQENVVHVGQTLAMAKAYYVPFSRQENVYRWCQYEITLLGDPEMPIWTDEPRELAVECPPSVAPGEQLFTVRVLDGGVPVSRASVCVICGQEVYERGTTDASGICALSVAPASGADSLVVTVTAHNYLPRIVKVPLQSLTPHVVFAAWRPLDPGRTPDALEPASEVALQITLRNHGATTAEQVRAVLRCESALATILDSTAVYGNIGPDCSATPVSPDESFVLKVAAQAGYGDVVAFSLTATDRWGQSWRSMFSVPVAAPYLCVARVTASDERTGDGDGLLEPGETVDLAVTLANQGSRPAIAVVLETVTEEEGIAVLTPRVEVGTIGSSDSGTVEIAVGIHHDVPEPYFPRLTMVLAEQGGKAFSASTTLIVGATGFFDDMEQPVAGYVHGGAHDLWHVTTRRAHSGCSSWYCGEEASGLYLPSTYTALITPQFRVPPDAKLSFWAWYDVAVYSQGGYRGDGLYVQVRRGQDWVTLDFIGTGGALDSTLMGNDWLPYSYDISFLRPGAVSAVRLLFESDPAEEHEGVYIDDIAVAPGNLTTLVAEPMGAVCSEDFEVTNGYPNPGNPWVEVVCKMPRPERVVVRIYDLEGRQVRTLLNGELEAGAHRVRWQGDDEQGRAVPSGLYFCVMTTTMSRAVRKLTVVR